jgi:threonine synthase
MAEILCTNCRRPYPEQGVPYRCPTCGGIYDFAGPLVFDPLQVKKGRPGLWRYRHSLNLPEDAPEVSLGEGNTPLIWGDAFGREAAYKLEFTNPTGSFKDRGSAALVSFLMARQAEKALEDSSGNAGASLAAYAARVSIAARVFVPDSTAGQKRAQIAAYGAEIVSIMGPRSNAAEAVKRAVEKDPGAVYASHAYLPFNLPGYATLAYELYEQLGREPGTLVLPVGQGGLMLGVIRGFAALRQAGLIAQIPFMVGVQARACAPLWALSSYGADGLAWVTEGPTLAEGVRVSRPIRGDAVLQAVEAAGGLFTAVDEEEILPGRDQLARRGLHVEATSALVWNGLSQILTRAPDPIVVVLTGAGLKSSV